MLHIQLPTTDEERLRVLEQLAYQKQLVEDDFDGLPVSLDLLGRAERMQQMFGNKLDLHRQATDMRQDNLAKHESMARELRLYISHFIQVYLFAIERGEMKPSTLALYKLDGESVPDLSSDEAIMEVSKNLIEGERNRIFSGGLPMSNPSIAAISMKYDKFKELVFNKKVKSNYEDLTLSQLEEDRAEVDEFIRKVADELEESAMELTDEAKVARYMEFGFDSQEKSKPAEPALEPEEPEKTDVAENITESTENIEEPEPAEALEEAKEPTERKPREPEIDLKLFEEVETPKEPELELDDAPEVESEHDVVSIEPKQDKREEASTQDEIEFEEVAPSDTQPSEEEIDFDDEFPEYIEEDDEQNSKPNDTQLNLWD